MKIRAVLFDLGGVLVELTGVATLLEWTRGRHSEAQLWQHWLTSPGVRAFESGRIDADEFAAALIAELRLPVAPAEFLHAFTYWPRGLFPGALELLAQLPRELTRACLSNTNSLHWPRLTGEMQLGEVFEYQFASHLTGLLKPDAAAFEHALAQLRLAPGEVLFLDDNQINVSAAAALGLCTHRVRGIAESHAVLHRAGLLARPPAAR